MRSLWRGVVAAAAIALTGPGAAAQAGSDELETILVSGEQPGPGLWRVSKDDHVLWILGTIGALPKDMTWRSQQVERLVAGSQEVIYPANVQIGADIGMFRALTLLPSALKAAKNPGGAKLADVLPPATYEKWRVLREKYLGKDDDVEKWRPTIALGRLRGDAFRKSGLTFGSSARSVVDRVAKKNHVKITIPPLVERKIHVEDPKRILKQASKTEFPELACFERGLDQLEPRLGDAKVAANAWATGDVDALRRRQRPHEGTLADADLSCERQMLEAVAGMDDAPGAKKAVDDFNSQAAIAERAQEWNWLNALQKALAANDSTFAILPMSQLLKPDGYVAKLRAAGYDVEEP